MMHSAASYRLPTFTGLISHGWSMPRFVRDQTEQDMHELDAQVQSGDFFVLLATELDTLGARIINQSVRMRLEDLVSDLIYLQEHYEITKKDSK
jgi:hypothetical protein